MREWDCERRQESVCWLPLACGDSGAVRGLHTDTHPITQLQPPNRPEQAPAKGVDLDVRGRFGPL